MPDDSASVAQASPDESATGRSDRIAIMAFLSDSETENVIREALLEAFPQGFSARRGNVRTAIAAMQKIPTPQVLIIDITGEEQPLTALGDLSDVVEPDVRVLVVGDLENVNFYRQVTRGLGVLEYLYKPLTRDMVARYFVPLLNRQAAAPEIVHGGRIVTITGARGGVGATTIAAHLAWHFGVTARRHTVLLDPDLHTGSAAVLLDAKTGPGLRTALESPQRVDDLFVERSAQPVAERLHVLAGEERLADQPNFAPNAAHKLVEALRRRYNFVLADVPFTGSALNRDLLDLAHQRVFIAIPTLAGVRETLRLLALPHGPAQARRAVVALNRVGIPGGLTKAQFEDALAMKVDVAIPDLPRQIGKADTLGDMELARKGGFRAGIIDLAREVAFVRMLDSAVGSNDVSLLENSKKRRGLLGLFR